MQGRGVGGGAPLLAEGSIALLALSQSNILMEKHLVQYSNNFKYFKKVFMSSELMPSYRMAESCVKSICDLISCQTVFQSGSAVL